MAVVRAGAGLNQARHRGLPLRFDPLHFREAGQRDRHKRRLEQRGQQVRLHRVPSELEVLQHVSEGAEGTRLHLHAPQRHVVRHAGEGCVEHREELEHAGRRSGDAVQARRHLVDREQRRYVGVLGHCGAHTSEQHPRLVPRHAHDDPLAYVLHHRAGQRLVQGRAVSGGGATEHTRGTFARRHSDTDMGAGPQGFRPATEHPQHTGTARKHRTACLQLSSVLE